MASKEFVGPVDCLGAALPDEEYFLLLARDPLAAGLTMIWASLRLGDFASATTNFQRLCTQPGLISHYREHPDQAKAEEAVEVAQRMVDWRERNLTAGEGGKPSWKSSRACGVERFVLSYAERLPAGPQRINVTFEQWPLWARTLRAPEPEAAKIACGLRQVTENMTGRSNREVEVVNDEHGFDLEAMNQYADRINGFAAELELIAGKPLVVIPYGGATDGVRQPCAETDGDCS
jgi:hypothetical protein